ncbi:MAG: ATPase, partial [Prevotella sp.]|nr:ATPase [Prevotella sp.]
HIVDASLRKLVIDNFRNFFRSNVSAYGRPDLPVGVVGSVGYYYSAELSEAADAEGFRLGRVERSPMAGLVDYHANQSR